MLIALVLCNAYAPAHAARIGTTEALQGAADRAALQDLLGRAEVARQLHGLGIDAAAARDRVAAMSDEEVRAIADRINALPAGADVAGILLLVVVVALIWWAWKR